MAMSLLQFAAQVQSPMIKGLVERVTNESFFLKALKFVECKTGMVYEYPRRDALPVAGSRA